MDKGWQRIKQYAYLMRLDKPIGILLLLWPTLWALWLAKRGLPDLKILLIFTAGVLLTRSAGCIINDYADKDFDAYVTRTKNRPLASKKISSFEALSLAALLALLALFLVFMCNGLTIWLSFLGAAIAIVYPFLKRVTHLPQLGLGLAFSWGVPMAFAAETARVPSAAWFVFAACTLWPIIYDTMYAMVDRSDDVGVGIKSTAILFDNKDTILIGFLQIVFVILLAIIGLLFDLRFPYYAALFCVLCFFAYQQWLIRERAPKACFAAFLNNHWVGLTIFIGIFLSYQQ